MSPLSRTLGPEARRPTPYRPTPKDLAEHVGGYLVRTLPTLISCAVLVALLTLGSHAWLAFQGRPSRETAMDLWGILPVRFSAWMVLVVWLLDIVSLATLRTPRPSDGAPFTVQRVVHALPAGKGTRGALWIADDGLHLVARGGERRIPYASLRDARAQIPTGILASLGLGRHFTQNLVLELAAGKELTFYVLAPVSVARTIRRALQVSRGTDSDEGSL